MKRQAMDTAKEEALRQRVRALSDDARLLFLSEVEVKLKDPDTYAALNYIFIAGLHHFYLGKWRRGLCNIAIFWLGVGLLFSGWAIVGIVMIVLISLFELYELFHAQVTVQAHNHRVQEEVFYHVQKIKGGAAEP